MKSASPLLALALAVAVGVAIWQGQRSERRVGELEAQRDRAREETKAAVEAAFRVDTLYLRDTLRLRRHTEHWDTTRTRVTITRNDTVFVPRAAADSAIAACGHALRTCEQRVDAVWKVADGYKAQLVIVEQLGRRPWTSIGLEYDGRWGGYLERDWSRFRAGLSVTPAPQDARVGIRIGVRW